MLRKLRATEWFKGGKFGLPLVDLYGKLLERPSEAALKAARDALPKDDQVEKLKRQFKELDLNRDGLLSFQEMDELLRMLAPQLSQNQRQKLFCAADVNQNGVLELEEFIDFVMYGKVAVAKVSTEDLAAFDAEPSCEEVGSTDVSCAETTYGTWSDWKEWTLEAHDMARRQHGVPALVWSDECYDLAKKQAQACQAAGQMLRGNCDGASGRHGQNLYWNPCQCPHPNVMVSSWLREAQWCGRQDAGGHGAIGGWEVLRGQLLPRRQRGKFQGERLPRRHSSAQTLRGSAGSGKGGGGNGGGQLCDFGRGSGDLESPEVSTSHHR